MTEQELNKAVVTRFQHEVLEQGDFNAYREIVSPDFINHSVPAGTDNGFQSTFDFIDQVVKKAFPDLRIEIKTMVAEGNKVFTHKLMHGTHTGEFMGIKGSGKQVVIPIMDIIYLKDGIYTDHWGIRDIQDVVKKAN
ncbi:ester cyclase [Mucilaginibacter lappiensis]|uniref:Ester cyclase n=1 Tax=Mucilaginibacter lappiensis TaxID=354630 RepID=A0A1N6ZK39_9SPHI|nr:ester cyclase [Mucilaginibacter lappiensis]MBB6110231.1 putative ester cyclase [Mucilaginibacter lappiensis]MBB6128664.1 putative ester cyclase [Mucilaginibacter lappiensis]SIR27081.1 SnoaL-like polyketide cyclase [Mucilaginibacter lappiensis]